MSFVTINDRPTELPYEFLWVLICAVFLLFEYRINSILLGSSKKDSKSKIPFEIYIFLSLPGIVAYPLFFWFHTPILNDFIVFYLIVPAILSILFLKFYHKDAYTWKWCTIAILVNVFIQFYIWLFVALHFSYDNAIDRFYSETNGWFYARSDTLNQPRLMVILMQIIVSVKTLDIMQLSSNDFHSQINKANFFCLRCGENIEKHVIIMIAEQKENIFCPFCGFKHILKDLKDIEMDKIKEKHMETLEKLDQMSTLPH